MVPLDPILGRSELLLRQRAARAALDHRESSRFVGASSNANGGDTCPLHATDASKLHPTTAHDALGYPTICDASFTPLSAGDTAGDAIGSKDPVAS
eukprot:g15962.t1